MKTVVIVAPCFAPSSYPPAIRTRFFASHLPEFGWRPVVLTVRPEFLEEPQDPEFLALLPPGLEIVRTPAISQRLTRQIGFGDLGLRSFPFHYHELSNLCQKGVDAILIPGPPWYSFCLGPWVGRRFGIPYVLDYIDPWVDSVGARASPFTKAWAARQVALLLERPAAIGASKIIAVSEGTHETVRGRYPEIPAGRCMAIPYGFEPADFETIRHQGEISSHLFAFKEKINICCVGAMLPRAYGTLRAFFRAIRKAQQTHSRAEQIRVHFFGTTYAVGSAARPLVLPVADDEGVMEWVTEHPERISYLEALKVLLSSNLILALGSSEPHYTASKIFPNLLARRPLLAVFHEASSVCDIMRRAGSGRLITYNDRQPAEAHVDEIAGALGEFLDGNDFNAHGKGVEAVAHDFSAREMTRLLARVLDEATE